MKLIIVGGVAGGATAAARARRISEDAEIILFERGLYVSYANCGLPYYIGKEIEQRDDLFVASPEKLEERYHIHVRISQEVMQINRDQKEVKVRDHTTGEEFFESYDKLLLSPGARPIKPPLPGLDSEKVFTLRDIPDSDSIKSFLENNQVKSAVIVGGGAIGLEALENFSRWKIASTVIEMGSQVLPPLDYEMAAIIHKHLRDNNIRLHLGDSVTSFEEKNDRLVVKTEKGLHIETDMALLSVGVKPEKELAQKAGLTIGERGGIAVDQSLQTSDPDIYAIGDAIEVYDCISGDKRLLALAGPANRQGRIAADNIMGRDSVFEGVLGTNVTRIFDKVAASTGAKEDFLKQKGIPHLVSFTHSFNHVTYYPGAMSMAVKLLFSPDNGKLLGAHIVGGEGVDKRIDVLATAMNAGMTVYDLEKLELAYAPQFGAAKDPVNIAGFVAANILKGDVEIVHWHELQNLDKEQNTLIDVRGADEINETGALDDALTISIDELRDRLDELDKNKTYILYCTVSLRGYLAFRILVQKGFKAKILSGGLETWTPIKEDRRERSHEP